MTFVNPTWITSLNKQYHIQCVKRKDNNSTGHRYPSIHMHEIARGLLNESRKNWENVNKKILWRVNFLAQKKLSYYQSNRFHFIISFFSALRNLFALGCFLSSAHLAQKISSKFANRNAKMTKNVGSKSKWISSKKGQVKSAPSGSLASEDKKNLSFSSQPKLEKIHSLKAKEPLSLSKKERMFQGLGELWKDNKNVSANTINEIWANLLEKAEIKNWELLGNQNFCITLSNPLVGRVSIFEFFINEKLQFKISEDSRSNKKVIEFVTGQNFGFVGPLNIRLLRVECDSANVTFVVKKIFTKNYTFPAQEAIYNLKLIHWSIKR